MVPTRTASNPALRKAELSDAPREVSVRIVNFQEIAGGDGDSFWKDDKVRSARMLGRGILDSGDAVGLVGDPARQLRGRVFKTPRLFTILERADAVQTSRLEANAFPEWDFR
jgi:hypothetical protein